MRATALLIAALLALVALAVAENMPPNNGLPLVKSAVPSFPPRPAWRLYTSCPIDRRNVPTVKEREA